MKEYDGWPAAEADIGVIGGSGLYRLLDQADEVELETPYGRPSGPVTVGSYAGRRVAFVPRHGLGHHLAPHQINSRANLWALRQLGVRRVIGPCAVGSLQPGIRPEEMVVLDQLVDRTWGRADTYLDGPVVEHVSFADPYCPELSGVLHDARGAVEGLVVHPTGTVVVIPGPRFSTRAESRSYRAAGWHVINMTQYPEAYLARELGLCYAGLALVTDHDSGAGEGADEGDPVSMDAVLAVLAANTERTRSLLAAALPAIPETAGCGCAGAGAPSLRA
ncbi:MAG: S-methyl-5'-thioadenosine phosphorylase [Acidimicrobiales bacterium]